jgi:hypothetical protein
MPKPCPPTHPHCPHPTQHHDELCQICCVYVVPSLSWLIIGLELHTKMNKLMKQFSRVEQRWSPCFGFAPDWRGVGPSFSDAQVGPRQPGSHTHCPSALPGGAGAVSILPLLLLLSAPRGWVRATQRPFISHCGLSPPALALATLHPQTSGQSVATCWSTAACAACPANSIDQQVTISLLTISHALLLTRACLGKIQQ